MRWIKRQLKKLREIWDKGLIASEYHGEYQGSYFRDKCEHKWIEADPFNPFSYTRCKKCGKRK